MSSTTWLSPASSAPGLAYEAGLLPTEANYFRRMLPLGVPVPEVLAAGVGIVGSCCGSAPEHTRAIRQALDAFGG